jgi:hypothetical protein
LDGRYAVRGKVAKFQDGPRVTTNAQRPRLQLATPHLVNLDTDPKERKPYDYPYVHTWVGEHVAKLLIEYQESLKREPLIPVGAPLDYVPKQKQP